MLAGHVTAVLGGPANQPTLTIREAADHAGRANSICISRLPDGQIRVDGRSQEGRASCLVNGYAYQDFAIGAAGLTINACLGGGCDTLRILPGMQLRNLALRFGESDTEVDRADFGSDLNSADLSSADLNFADSFLMP
jgi:hypothetical protein